MAIARFLECKAVATSNITLSGQPQTIDGISVVTGNSVLAVGQTTAGQNGVWTVAAGAWTRDTNALTQQDFLGMTVVAREGTASADTIWQCRTDPPITVGTTALTFAQLPGFADKVLLKQLEQVNGGINGTAVALTDADQDLTVAGGRRYVQATPLKAKRVKKLMMAGAVVGDIITIERSDGTYHSMQIDSEGGAHIGLSQGPFDTSSYRYDGPVAGWVLDRSLPDTTKWPVYNVRDFGARGDEYLTGTESANEAEAIQDCIDAAAARAEEGLHSGARIYFPPGNYITTGYPILLRRTPFTRPLWYEGAGWQLVTIQNQSVDQTGDAFRVETEAECTTRVTNVLIARGVDPEVAAATAALNMQTHGGNGHVFKNIGINSGGYCFVWDLGLATSDLGEMLGDGHRFCGIVENVYLSRQRPGPAVRLHKPSRVQFKSIRVDPANSYAGAFAIEVRRGSASLEDAIGGTGMFRAYEGNEIHIQRCTSNGAWGTPAWDFTRCFDVSVKQTANEGHGEWDAIYRFDRCTGVICEQAALATADRGYPWLTGLVAISGTPTLTFAHVDPNYLWLEVNSITRSAGSWHADQIGIGSRVKVPGSTANNPATWYTVIEATHETLYVKATEPPIVAETVNNATGVVGTQYNSTNSLQPTLQFFAATKKLTRTAGAGQPGAGSWIVDGFKIGDVINGSWSTNPGKLYTPGITITAITDTDLTFGGSAIVNEGPMTGRYLYRNGTAAGIVFRATESFSALGTLGGGFSAQGDTSRYGIEVDAACRNGRVELRSPTATSDIKIDPVAYNVVGECYGLTETFPHGTHRLAALEVVGTQLRLRAGKTADISTLGGVSIKQGTGNGYVGMYYDPTVGDSGWKAATSPDEGVLGTQVPMHALRFVGPSTGTDVVAKSGAGTNLWFTTTNLGDTLRWQFLQSGGPLMNTFGDSSWASSGYVSIEAASFNQLVGATTVDLRAGGLLGVRVSSTGVTLGGDFTEHDGQISSAIQVDADGATVTFNFNQGNVHQVTLAGNRTLAFSSLRSGATYVLFLIQDGTGNRTVSWPASAKFGAAGVPVLSTAASKRDAIIGTSDGTNVYFHTVTRGF
jgi:hypothetical protein